MRYVILGHSNPDVDSILSGILLERILSKKDSSNEYRFIIPDEHIEDITSSIISSIGIDISKYRNNDIKDDDQLILVDHHEERRYKNKISSIYDHHPATSNICDTDIYVNKENSCSTTIVIYKLFEECFTKDDFILVLVGALVDTVSFKSNKTNQEEVLFLNNKCKEYDIDINKYINLGLCLNDLSNIDKVYLNGLKKYNIDGKIIESSYIQIKDVDNNIDNINRIINKIKEYVNNNNIDIFVFIVHDMDIFKTTTYEITSNGIDVTKYDNYTSRGNTIIPNISKKIKLQD